MKRKYKIVALCLVLCSSMTSFPSGKIFQSKPVKTIAEDYKQFYSGPSLTRYMLGLGVAGMMANSSADQNFADWYQRHLVTPGTNSAAKVFKWPGYNYNMPIAYVSAYLIGRLISHHSGHSVLQNWGSRSFQALLVGLPPMWLTQKLLGSGRPSFHSVDSSYWTPFKHDQGASGHAFMGAVPFITAAQMTNNLYLKVPLYFASTLTGWSRINDNQHYLSQVMLGWWIAYLSVRSVSHANDKLSIVTVSPMAMRGGGVGASVNIQV